MFKQTVLQEFKRETKVSVSIRPLNGGVNENPISKPAFSCLKTERKLVLLDRQGLVTLNLRLG